MANTGNTFPGTGENVDRSGLTAWTNPGNIVSDNATDATCSGAGSDYLVARNFGFTLPAGATIKGIFVRVEASEHSGGTEPLLAQLQDASGALIGSSKSGAIEGDISGTTKAVYTYGGTADLWGATLTEAIVEDADFGVRLWFATSHDVRIDFVTVAVEYDVGAMTADLSGVGTLEGTLLGSGALAAGLSGVGTLSGTLVNRVKVNLDASDISTLWKESTRSTQVSADGDEVGAVDAQPGTSIGAAQPTAGKLPLYKTNIFGSLPGILFGTGGDEFLDTDSFSLAQPITVFLVVKITDAGTSQKFIDGKTDRIAVMIESGSLAFYAGTVVNVEAAATGAFVLTVVFNGASSAFYRDTSADLDGGGNPSTSGLSGGIRIGIESGGSVQAFSGYLGQLIVAEGLFSDTEREEIRDALIDKWIPDPGAMTADLSGVGTLAGTLTGSGALAADLSGPGTLAGTLTGSGALAADLSGVGTLTGTLDGLAPVAADLSGVGTLTGTLLGAGALEAPLSGVGTLTGDLTGAGALEAPLSGAGTLTGTLTGSGALAVDLAGPGTLTGTLTGSGALAAALGGVGTLEGTLTDGTGQSAAIQGAGTLTGTLTGSGALACAMAGAGTLEGTLDGLAMIAADIGGVGTLAGTLTQPIVYPPLFPTKSLRDRGGARTIRDRGGARTIRDTGPTNTI